MARHYTAIQRGTDTDERILNAMDQARRCELDRLRLIPMDETTRAVVLREADAAMRNVEQAVILHADTIERETA